MKSILSNCIALSRWAQLWPTTLECHGATLRLPPWWQEINSRSKAAVDLVIAIEKWQFDLWYLCHLVPFWRERNQAKSMWGVQNGSDLQTNWRLTISIGSAFIAFQIESSQSWTFVMKRLNIFVGANGTLWESRCYQLQTHDSLSLLHFALQAIYVLLVWRYLDDLDAWGCYGFLWLLLIHADPLPSGFRRCREARQLRGTFSSCQAVNHV